MQNQDDNKNMIMFLIAAMVMLFAYQFIFLAPIQKREAAQRAAAVASSSAAQNNASAIPSAVSTAMTYAQAIAASPRVAIDTPSLKGSISLIGARIDDLSLVKFKQSLDKNSPNVELLAPVGTKNAFYTESGFIGQNIPNLPDAKTLWTVKSGTVLSVGKPVVLGFDNGTGLSFERTLKIDENYMISVSDKVINTGPQAVTLSSYAKVVRIDLPSAHNQNVHEGTIATWSKLNGSTPQSGYLTQGIKYKDMIKKEKKAQDTIGGWFGLTDTYWLAAVIPDQKTTVNASMEAKTVDNKPVFLAGFIGQGVTINAGAASELSYKIFAGAKQNGLLQAYGKAHNLPRFDQSIDWGMLSFLTQPMHWLLDILYKALKNFGLAILALTVVVKIIFYPLAHKSYESMMKMKHVQQHLAPKLEAIKAKFPNDPQKQQEETMALYQREKINPMAGLSGCLPMLLQMPVFFALYKVLLISIDMRHAPFFGFMKDLSAPDPTSLINLFGLLPFDPATVPLIGGFLAGPAHIGIVAILYGFTMWVSQRMTPMTSVDPMQKKMMEFMPIMFTFIMAQFAVGLLVYWVWSNLLTMLQQYSIMRRLKVENVVDTTIAKINDKFFKKNAA